MVHVILVVFENGYFFRDHIIFQFGVAILSVELLVKRVALNSSFEGSDGCAFDQENEKYESHFF
jgi:hypothetical protein